MRIPEGFLEADVIALHEARVLLKSPQVNERWPVDPYLGLERETGFTLFFEDLQILAEVFGLPFNQQRAADLMLVQDRNLVGPPGQNALSHFTGLDSLFVKEGESRLEVFAVFRFDFQDQQLDQKGRYAQRISYQGPYSVWYPPEEIDLGGTDTRAES